MNIYFISATTHPREYEYFLSAQLESVGRACALPNIWCKPVQRCVEFRNAMLHRAARGIYMPCVIGGVPCTMSTACGRQLAQTVMMLMGTDTTKRVRGPDEDLASVPGLPHERALIVRGRL